MTTKVGAPDQPATRIAPAARRRGWWKLPVLAVACCLAVFELRGHLPSAAATGAALRHASVTWLIVAAALQVLSVVAFAEQERRLLRAFGVAMAARLAIAMTAARTAMAIALPGGSAVAAAYGFQQFRARGATRPVAAAVTMLCGVASVAGLATLYAGDALLRTGAVTAAAIAIPAVAVLIPAARRLRRTDLPPPGDGPVSRLGRLRRTAQETLLLAAVVPVRKWVLVLALAGLNWLADLLCLLACLHAFGLTVSVPVVATAYLGAQLARQIPVTAAGIGVIEAELILALTTSGRAPVAAAAAAVLAYRLLSCWLMLPIGAACWSALRTRPA